MTTYQFPLSANDKKIIKETLLNKSGSVVYPTETFYALGCAANQADAVLNIYLLKKRNPDLPLLVLVNSWEMLHHYIDVVLNSHLNLLKKHWPGPLTAILPQNGKLAKELNRNENTLGFRMTSSPIAQELIAIAGVPLVGTSANLSSEREADDVQMAQKSFGNSVDIYIDGGKTPGIKPSTLIDMTKERYTVVREGMISI